MLQGRRERPWNTSSDHDWSEISLCMPCIGILYAYVFVYVYYMHMYIVCICMCICIIYADTCVYVYCLHMHMHIYILYAYVQFIYMQIQWWWAVTCHYRRPKVPWITIYFTTSFELLVHAHLCRKIVLWTIIVDKDLFRCSTGVYHHKQPENRSSLWGGRGDDKKNKCIMTCLDINAIAQEL